MKPNLRTFHLNRGRLKVAAEAAITDNATFSSAEKGEQ